VTLTIPRADFPADLLIKRLREARVQKQNE
jgi:hypothetical protein